MARDVRSEGAMRVLLTTYLWLALGGALGTLGRYVLSGAIDSRYGPSPLGIFVVNVSGAFVIGFFLVLAQDRILVSPDLRRFVATGLCGGYTTFSTFSYDTMTLIEDHRYATAAANGLGSLAAGLLAVWLGMTLARAV
jgi:fluoride exporter